MTIAFGLGVVLWILVTGAFWLVRLILRDSIEVKQEDLEHRADGKEIELLQTIAALRSLDAIALTIYMTILPIAGVVIGVILPAHIREVFEQFIGPEALVAVSLGALFGYGALIHLWTKQSGAGLKKLIRNLLEQPVEPASPSVHKVSLRRSSQ
jgi:hypothetical protein